MRDYIDERVTAAARYITQTKATVRAAAKILGVSKSTIHTDVTERLPKLNPPLAASVREILAENLAVRHVRGGEATKRKYGKNLHNI